MDECRQGGPRILLVGYAEGLMKHTSAPQLLATIAANKAIGRTGAQTPTKAPPTTRVAKTVVVDAEALAVEVAKVAEGRAIKGEKDTKAGVLPAPFRLPTRGAKCALRRA
jgi:hypothetical protein